MRRVGIVLVLALAASGARADILLSGFQHVGEHVDAAFTPAEPVLRNQMAANPSHFHLSIQATVTAVVFENAVSLDGQIVAIVIDGIARTGTLSGARFTLATPLTLSQGQHTLWPDPGCMNNQGKQTSCPGGRENDIGFSALRLVSGQGTSSVMLTQRRHVGDGTDINDDYGGRFYPDSSEGVSASAGFTLDRNRTLSVVRIYRLRDVLPSAPARFLLDGQEVGDRVLTGNGNPFTFEPNRALTAGAHTLTLEAGTLPGNPGRRDAISWDDVLLYFGDTTVAVAGGFNAVDPGQNAAGGQIRTKVAGAAFPLDLYALDSFRSGVLKEYTGTLRVDLLDAGSDAGVLDGSCRASWTTIATLATATIGATDLGHRQVSFTIGGALRRARLRLTDEALGIVACSTDDFAVRPAGFGVVVSDDDALSAGTSRRLDVVDDRDPARYLAVFHRSGRPFTVTVTPVSAGGGVAAGYANVPQLQVEASLLGPNAGLIVADAASWRLLAGGALRTDAAAYTEAGAFRLSARDDQFADTDADDAGSTLAERTVPPTTVDVGRFIPDHFAFDHANVPVLSPGCGTFSYVGDKLQFQVPPEIVVKAVDASGGFIARNYTGALAGASGGAATVSMAWTAVDAPAFDSNGPLGITVVDEGAGDADPALDGMFTLKIPALLGGPQLSRGAPLAPFALEAALSVDPANFHTEGDDPLSSADDVGYADPDEPLVIFGEPVAGKGIAFLDGASTQRFGRLASLNVYGSERLPLKVPYRVEYFEADGFRTAVDDSCTVVPDVSLADAVNGIAVSEAPTPLVQGQGSLTLSPPDPSVRAVVKVRFVPAAWLKVDADRDGTWFEDLETTATFGVNDPTATKIYQQEIFR